MPVAWWSRSRGHCCAGEAPASVHQGRLVRLEGRPDISGATLHCGIVNVSLRAHRDEVRTGPERLGSDQAPRLRLPSPVAGHFWTFEEPGAAAHIYDGIVYRVTIPSRPLSPREQEVLRYLLAFDLPPAASDVHRALLAQVQFARVTGRCDCGCATVDLSVDPTRAMRAPVPEREAPYAEAQHMTEPRDLMLFVQDGWLSSIEIVDHDGVHAAELPDPLRFGPAHLTT